MAEDLHDALTDIDGVGPARAEEIAAVVDEHGTDVDVETIEAQLTTAREYLEDDRPGHADKFVRRALDEL